MFWKSAGSYNAVPVVTGTCMDICTRVYYTWKHGSFHVWVSFTLKFPRSFEAERKCNSQFIPALKKGLSPRTPRFGLDEHPEVGMTIWSSCICKFGLDQLRTGVVMTFPILHSAIQAGKGHLLHHNTLKFGELEEQTGKVGREEGKVWFL